MTDTNESGYFLEQGMILTIDNADFKGGKDAFVEGTISNSDLDLAGEIVPEDEIDRIVEKCNAKSIEADVEHSIFRSGMPGVPIHKGAVAHIVKAWKSFENGIAQAKARFKMNRSHPDFEENWKSLTDKSLPKEKQLTGFSIYYRAMKSKGLWNGVERTILRGLDLINVAFTHEPVNTSCDVEGAYMKSIGANADLISAYQQNAKSQHRIEVGEMGKSVDHQLTRLGALVNTDITAGYVTHAKAMSSLKSILTVNQFEVVAPMISEAKSISSQSSVDNIPKGTNQMAPEPTTPAAASTPSEPAFDAKSLFGKLEQDAKSMAGKVATLESTVTAQAAVIAEQAKSIAAFDAIFEKPAFKSLASVQAPAQTATEAASPLHLIK